MKYPEEIIPKSNYRILDDLGPIFNDGKVCLLRRIDTVGDDASEQKIKDYLRKILGNGRHQFNEYSLSMVGGGFKLEHMRYRVKVDNDIDDTWKGGEDCTVESFIHRVEECSNYSVIYFNANDVHNIPLGPDDHSKIGQSFKTETKKNQPDLEEPPLNRNISFIKHKPTIFNYWHVQIHFLDSEGNEFPSQSGPGAKKLNSEQRESLQTFLDLVLFPLMKLAKVDEINCESIDRTHYIIN